MAKPVCSFAHFGFDEYLMTAIRRVEYTQPTPIQAQVDYNYNIIMLIICYVQAVRLFMNYSVLFVYAAIQKTRPAGSETKRTKRKELFF